MVFLRKLSPIPVIRKGQGYYLGALTLILFGAFALRLWNLGTQSLWHDEAWSIFSAYHPLARDALGTDPNSPPIFYLALGGWMQLVGDGMWALRYWSLLIGVVTVAVTAWLTRKWIGERAAIVAASLIAMSPILWVYSQEIRAYVAMPLYALILLALLDQLLRMPSRRTWLWLLLVELLALYTHNLAVPLVTWLNIAAIVGWLTRRDAKHLGLWLATQIGLAIAYLPWLLTQRQTGTPLNSPPAIQLSVMWEIWQSYFTGIKTLLDADPPLTILIAVLGVLGLVTLIIALLGKRSQRVYLLVSQALLLPIFELAIIWAAHIDFHPRYFIVGVPAALMVIAVALTPGYSSIRRPISRNLWGFRPGAKAAGLNQQDNTPRIVDSAPVFRAGQRTGDVRALTVCFLAALTTIQMLRVTFSSPVYQHDNFRAMAEYYAKLPSDAAIVIPYGWEPTLAYYATKMTIRAPIVGIPLGSSWQTIVDRLNEIQASRIEVLTWYQLPADLRGAYSCLLGAVTEQAPETFTVNGLTSAGFQNPGQITAKPLTIDAGQTSFDLFTAKAAEVIANDQRACVISDWTRTASNIASEPYRATVGILNPLGWEFVQNDGDLRDDRQIPAQFWTTGQSGTAFTLLNYPIGTPAGTYPLVVGLYGANSLNRLNVIQNGAPAGQNAPFGQLAITPAPPDDSVLQAIRFSQVTDTLGVTLITPGSDACTLQPGEELRVTALWRMADPAAQTVTLRLSGTDWQIDRQVSLASEQAVTRSWSAFPIPAQASGSAQLVVVGSNLGNSTALLKCTIASSSHLLNPPPMGHSLGVAFQGVGTLAGFDLPAGDISHAGTLPLTLYWQAGVTAVVSYTVFTHLLNATGQVIAQNDSPPANGNRPTTGWLSGEYVIDPHTLTFNAQGQDYSGTASIEVGLYDAATGRRVLLANGADHVLLPVTLTVR